MGIRYSTNGVRDNYLHETYISKKFAAAQICQGISFRFWQSNIPVSCSQQHIFDRQAEPQVHSSDRHNTRDLRHKTVTEGESS